MITLFIIPLSFLAADPVADQAVKILNQNCVRCHNETKTRGGLSLANRESALLGGATSEAVVPSKPSESLLLARAADGSMPPEKDGRRLTADEVRVLSDWIERGANWPAESRQPIPTPPSVTLTPVMTCCPDQPRRRILFQRSRRWSE